MLRTPLEPFFFLSLLRINSAKKDYARKNVQIWCPLLKKILSKPKPLTRHVFKGLIHASFSGLNVTPNMTRFQRACSCLFLKSNVFVFG